MNLARGVALSLAAALATLLHMANIYGPQDWTAGTFTVTTPDTGDGNYPETIYREEVKTVNAAGPNGERILDSDDYGSSAHTIYNFATLGGDANYVNMWNGGAGIWMTIDVLFSSDVETDVGFAAIWSLGNRRASPEAFLKNFGLDMNFGAGELEVTTRGDGGAVGFGSYTADDQWYTLKVYLLPSSDEGFTDDGIVRIWKKPSTSSAASYTLEYENANSFLFTSPFAGAPDFGQNYVNFGRFGILPSTNFTLYDADPDAGGGPTPDEITASDTLVVQVSETSQGAEGPATIAVYASDALAVVLTEIASQANPIVAAFVIGAYGTVNSSRTMLINLDNVVRTVSAEGGLALGGDLLVFEQGTAPAPIAGAAILYAEDDGGGKTRLMALFPTGAAQQVEIEP